MTGTVPVVLRNEFGNTFRFFPPPNHTKHGSHTDFVRRLRQWRQQRDGREELRDTGVLPSAEELRSRERRRAADLQYLDPVTVTPHLSPAMRGGASHRSPLMQDPHTSYQANEHSPRHLGQGSQHPWPARHPAGVINDGDGLDDGDESAYENFSLGSRPTGTSRQPNSRSEGPIYGNYRF